MFLIFDRHVKHEGRDADRRRHALGLLARSLVQVSGDLRQRAFTGVLRQQSRRVPHHLFEGFRPSRELPFRERQPLDGVREIVHAPFKPLPFWRPTDALSLGVQVVRGVAERGSVDGFEVTCLEALRQDDRQHAFNILPGAVQARPQPGGRVLLDRSGRGELRLHDHRLAARRSDENIGPLARVRARQGLVNHVGPLCVDSPVVPVGIPSAQRTGQGAVRLRFGVARAAHAGMALGRVTIAGRSDDLPTVFEATPPFTTRSTRRPPARPPASALSSLAQVTVAAICRAATRRERSPAGAPQ